MRPEKKKTDHQRDFGDNLLIGASAGIASGYLWIDAVGWIIVGIVYWIYRALHPRRNIH